MTKQKRKKKEERIDLNSTSHACIHLNFMEDCHMSILLTYILYAASPSSLSSLLLANSSIQFSVKLLTDKKNMAGAGAATHKDLSLPEEQERVFKQQNDDVPLSFLKDLNPKRGQTMDTVRKTKPLSLWQLNALIVMVVLSASGMVSPLDLARVCSLLRPTSSSSPNSPSQLSLTTHL